jgi:hypothetical protein
MGVIGGVLVVLAGLAVALRGRARRAEALVQQATERHEAEVAEVLQRRRIREEEHARQKRAHEESVAAAAAARAKARVQIVPAEPKAPAGLEAMMCPTCGRDFPSPTTFCPADGTALMPASRASGATVGGVAGPVAAAKRGKICPTCGDRFDGVADYCGKDGTQLVLLN